MIYLVEGTCPCIKEARMLLRRCGYLPGRDYEEIDKLYMRKSNLFKEHPELYGVSTMVLYNKDNGMFINLSKLKLTQQIRRSIDAMFASDIIKKH